MLGWLLGKKKASEGQEESIELYSERAAIEALIEHGHGQPLLDLLIAGKIKWASVGFTAVSLSGRLMVENDMYFYLTVRRGVSSYSVSNLTDRVMASKLECAAINTSRIGRAVNCYDPDAPDYSPRD